MINVTLKSLCDEYKQKGYKIESCNWNWFNNYLKKDLNWEKKGSVLDFLKANILISEQQKRIILVF